MRKPTYCTSLVSSWQQMAGAHGRTCGAVVAAVKVKCNEVCILHALNPVEKGAGIVIVAICDDDPFRVGGTRCQGA
jgi:hypothetical protein